MGFLSILLSKGTGVIGKRLEIDVENKIFAELVKYINNAYTIKDESEINQILKKGNIREFYSKTSVEGLCYPYLKTICLKPSAIKKVLEGEMDNTVIHEAIHLLKGIQHPNIFKKDMTGFEEGATEYMTFKAMGTLGKIGSKYLLNSKGQKAEYNIPHSSYIECTSIMAQLGIIFGEKKLQEFAFGENNDLLKNIKKSCGNDFYEYLRKELNKYAAPNRKRDHSILKLQSELLERCYLPKFAQIETIDDAATLFKNLQEINKVRAHFDEDKSFEEFYKNQYEKCIQRFGKNFENLEYLKYQEIEFLNVTSKSNIKNRFNTSIKSIICDSNANLEKSLELLNDTTRYIAKYQDTFYQVCIFKDKSVYFELGNEKEGISPTTLTTITNPKEEILKLRKFPSMPKFNSNFYLKKNNDDNNQNYTLIIDGEEVPLAEIDLGVTKEEVESYYSLINSSNQKKTFKERFLSLFSMRKTKLLDTPKNKDNIDEKNSKPFIDSIKTTSTIIDKNLTNKTTPNQGNTLTTHDNTE